jgi:ATP-dependent RNA helicase DDX47/RRP3
MQIPHSSLPAFFFPMAAFSFSHLMKRMKAAPKKRREHEAAEVENDRPAQTSSGPELLDNEENKEATFESLGLCPELCAACTDANWRHPTRIQAATIPVATSGKDLVGVAQTGSGKTGAYVLPMVNWLLTQPKAPFLSVLVMVPTRELALQVTEQFTMLGRSVGLKVVTLVGGVDMVEQAIQLSKRPHVVVGTPGRIKDHLTNTKGFHMMKLHALVLDEADKMLDMDYEKEIDSILEHLPRERQTLLFSATLSTKIDRLQKASLVDPVVLAVHRANSTVKQLSQQYIFAPFGQMLSYLHCYLTKETGNHILIFCQSAALVHKITLMLRVLGHHALPLMGRMTQENRNIALTKFKEAKVRILVCTDLAQRGLDIPHTDVVVNYALPLNVKDYIHRVGRTARAGSAGKAVNLISQYDIPQLQEIEKATGVRCTEFPILEGEVNLVLQRVEDAEQEAIKEIREGEQIAKLEKEERVHTAPREAKRVRSQSSLSYDDSKHGQADFSALRMRRDNEEVFGMTKKDQRKSLWAKRREAKKSARPESR